MRRARRTKPTLVSSAKRWGTTAVGLAGLETGTALERRDDFAAVTYDRVLIS
ncbi:hypothetical protein MCNS_50080 [Mycobacterium conspicuum]|uniref:Uncharacterized protein n=1 Tax=Mycobacterium conspicuum TaxID=44010 RepID=A0A7I7YJE2_9MYCO|nr:hypothetical protein MCNS_50080 [Mycobacterium conspicuum]